MKKNLIEAVTKQIRHEQNNAHIYQSLAVYFEVQNLHGFGAWFTKQAGDERMHAEKFIKHLVDRGVPVEFGDIQGPAAPAASPLAATETALALEKTTTGLIHKLYELAKKEGDYALEVLLHWFVTEQVEEEQSAQELVDWMTHFHKTPSQLYNFDHRWRRKAE